VLACAAALLFATADPGEAAPFVPASDDRVLERLPTAPGDPAMRELRAWRAALARDPGDLRLAVQVARRYSELGRVSGDPRYSGYAQAAIAPWWDRTDAPREVRLLRATLRQRVHDFEPALADLSALLKADPGDAQARLARATIRQVRGDFEGAAADCEALRSLAPEPVWAACAYGVRAATGDLQRSYRALAATVSRHPRLPSDLRAWLQSILGEMAARAGLDSEAEAHFLQALQIDPTDQYTLGAYADFLLDAGRAREVIVLLDERSRTDALMLRHALALQAVGSPLAPARIEQLRARFEASRLRGDRVHQREEARFALHLLADRQAALQLARENWSLQREPLDARTLLEAAQAAGDAASAREVREWVSRTRLEDRRLAQLLQP
jgi:Tfp pilus assembly protein PilF